MKLVARVLVLTALLVLVVYSAAQQGWYVTTATAIVLAILSVAEIIWFLNRWKRELNRFLLLLKHRDYSGFSTPEGVPGDYRATLSAIAAEFRNVRLEKERHYQFLLALTQHIRTALICFNPDGRVVLANQAMYDLLGIALLNETRQIRRVSESLYDVVTGYTGVPAVSIVIKGKLHRLSVHRTQIVLDRENVTIASLREIGSELDENESEAWQKLFQVLTHEIMNSATPIASLSQALDSMLGGLEAKPGEAVSIAPDDFSDLKESLGSIRERSQGLIRFAGAYKNLTRMPQPRFEHFPVSDLALYAKNLLGNTFDERGISLVIKVFPSDMELFADPEMIQRVLINLLLNSMYAVENVSDPRVDVVARLNEAERVMITVTDNGHGIAPEHFGDIFIPFFTTRKNGSGLGLSISREIMRLHRGHIRVDSIPGKGTEVVLFF